MGSIFRPKGRIASLSSVKLETFKGWISLCDLAELHLVDSSWWDPEGDRLFYEILDGGGIDISYCGGCKHGVLSLIFLLLRGQ